MKVGDHVVIMKEQPRYLGGPKCPGRRGKIIRILGRDPNDKTDGTEENVYYVELEPTKRSRRKTELFFGWQMNVTQPINEKNRS